MKPHSYSLFALALVAATQVHGATVTLVTGGDAANTSSFNSGIKWSDATAPSAANDYVVAVTFLRTPQSAFTGTFGGNSLSINTGGAIIYKGFGTTSVLTVNNLILNGGFIRSGSSTADTMILAGNITINGTGSIFQADQSPFIINSVLSGTGTLATTSGQTTTFNATNTYTGNLTVSSSGTPGTVLSTTSTWKFAIGANGVNNTIIGAGKVALNGTFNVDLTTAGTTIGNTWQLVANSTLTETYASTFSLSGFTSDSGTAGFRIWTRNNGGIYYQFNEATGALSVVNPDTDGDGLGDAWEIANFGNLTAQNGTGDPDGDGATNEEEETAGTNPNLNTSWPDVDADGLKDAWEIANFGNLAQTAAGDADGDLSSNLTEFTSNTLPNNAASWPDSDFDSMNDAWEIAYFGNLSKDGSLDTDGDTFTDFEEHEAHTNPSLTVGTALSPIGAVLKNRWSFNGNLTDSVGSSTATIVDVGANNVTYNDITTPTAITLAGGTKATSDYVSLGTNLLPKSTTPVTIELWAKQNAIQNWSRIFDFHSSTTEELFMSWTTAVNGATDRVEWADGGVTTTANNTNQPYGTTDEFHIVMTLQPLAGFGGKTKVTWYSAPAGQTDLGAAKGSFQTVASLVNFNDTINALGLSPFADNVASATYNEVRIWNGALSTYSREKLHDQGPDNATIDDTDGDFLPDAWEVSYFPGNLTALTTLGDYDSDGTNNRDEFIAGSAPNNNLSTPTDLDGDGLLDTWEITYFTNITAQNGSGDPDNDGFTNLQEQTNNTNPTSDDNDGDGLSDNWEILYFTNTTAQDGSGDPDGDTFTNEVEETAGSNPTLAASTPTDVDGDGLLDTWEVTYFTNITAQNGSGDPDGDTYTNEQEETGKSNPTLTASIPGDVNGDGITDGHLLIATDVLGTASFNSGINWDDANAPVSGSNYLVSGLFLRTPDDINPYTFAGDKLVMTTTSVLVVKGTGALTIPYLGLDGGQIRNATSANASFTLEGAITVSRASELFPQNSGIVVNAVLSGTKDLSVLTSGVNAVTFNAANTWTGNLNVPGSFILGSTGKLAFKPGATTVTNAVAGAGTVAFDGAFEIDLSSASTTTGDNWALVNAATLTETYGATFAVTGFTADAAAAGARKWTSASGLYQFDEATGVLTRLAPTTNDTDTDGMDDTWETTYFGGLGQSATGDFDGDGTNNLTEFRLGLTPNSGTSRFAATRGAAGLLTWPSVVGVNFTVQRSTTLAPGSWTTIGTVSGTAGTASFTDPSAPTGKAFYQILLEP